MDFVQLLKMWEWVGEICGYISDFQRTTWWISNEHLLSKQMNDLAYSLLLFTLSTCKMGMQRPVTHSSFLPSIHHHPIHLYGLWSCSQWGGRVMKLVMIGKTFPSNKSSLPRTFVCVTPLPLHLSKRLWKSQQKEHTVRFMEF